jgi:hypothetical protein
MSDRLSDLQRQRALLQEHLAWLDREITQASNTKPTTPASPGNAQATSAALPTPLRGPNALQPSATVPLDGPQETAGAMAADAKRGCLIAFAVGMVLFFALVLGAYFLTRGGD